MNLNILYIACLIKLILIQSPVDRHNEKALSVLNNSLQNSSKWVKVHAAEYLMKLGYHQKVLKKFREEEKMYKTEPKYRIGVWRVLIEAERNKAEKRVWLEKIYEVYKNAKSADRLHATETLAKLNEPVKSLFREITINALQSSDRQLKLYAFWASTNSTPYLQQQSNSRFIETAVDDPDILIRKISSYILRYRNNLTPGQWQNLSEKCTHISANNDLYITLLTTALVTAPENMHYKRLEDASADLLKNIGRYDVPQLMDICNWLAVKGSKNELPLLEKLLDEKLRNKSVFASGENADLCNSAAYAILKINQRNEDKK